MHWHPMQLRYVNCSLVNIEEERMFIGRQCSGVKLGPCLVIALILSEGSFLRKTLLMLCLKELVLCDFLMHS